MIEVKEFLREKLNVIFLSLEGVELAYEYRISTNTHIVEVKPLEKFNSEEYVNMEIALEEAFKERFPYENLLFVSEDSLTKIKTPEFNYSVKLNLNIMELSELGFNELSQTNTLYMADQPIYHNLAA